MSMAGGDNRACINVCHAPQAVLYVCNIQCSVWLMQQNLKQAHLEQVHLVRMCSLCKASEVCNPIFILSCRVTGTLQFIGNQQQNSCCQVTTYTICFCLVQKCICLACLHTETWIRLRWSQRWQSLRCKQGAAGGTGFAWTGSTTFSLSKF